MSKKIEDDFEDLLKLGENTGISDLMELFNQYEEYTKTTEDYLKLHETNFYYSTSNSTE